MELNKREKVVSYALGETRKDITMGKVKYSEEMKLQTVKYVLEVGEKVEILKNPCTSLCNHGNEM